MPVLHRNGGALPHRFLRFVETDEFTDDWRNLKLDVEFDLWDLQIEIMENPSLAPVIPGTGGLRKVRFAPRSRNQGKRGAIRVCYVYFAQYRVVLLVMAYAKSERDDLTQDEKHAIKTYLHQIEAWLERESPRNRRI